MTTTSPNQEGVEGTECEEVWMITGESVILFTYASFVRNPFILPHQEGIFLGWLARDYTSLRNSWAVKEVEGVGLFMSVWQAKKLGIGKKVGIGVVRELADTCHEQKASKGIIVTTTTLTNGAIQRIQRDRYILGKVDRDDLLAWIRRIRSS